MVVLYAGVQDQEEDPKHHDHAWKPDLEPPAAGLSSRGSQVVVPNSGHNIPDEAPEAVVQAIRNVLIQARTAPPRAEKSHSSS